MATNRICTLRLTNLCDFGVHVSKWSNSLVVSNSLFVFTPSYLDRSRLLFLYVYYPFNRARCPVSLIILELRPFETVPITCHPTIAFALRSQDPHPTFAPG